MWIALYDDTQCEKNQGFAYHSCISKLHCLSPTVPGRTLLRFSFACFGSLLKMMDGYFLLLSASQWIANWKERDKGPNPFPFHKVLEF